MNETKHRVVANYAERSTTGKSWRVTMTAPFINRAANILILVTGQSKSATLKHVLEEPPNPEKYPVQLIEPVSGKLAWLRSTFPSSKPFCPASLSPPVESDAGALSLTGIEVSLFSIGLFSFVSVGLYSIPDILYHSLTFFQI